MMTATLKAASDAVDTTGDVKDSNENGEADEQLLVASMDGYPSTPHFPFSPSVMLSVPSPIASLCNISLIHTPLAMSD